MLLTVSYYLPLSFVVDGPNSLILNLVNHFFPTWISCIFLQLFIYWPFSQLRTTLSSSQTSNIPQDHWLCFTILHDLLIILHGLSIMLTSTTHVCPHHLYHIWLTSMASFVQQSPLLSLMETIIIPLSSCSPYRYSFSTPLKSIAKGTIFVVWINHISLFNLWINHGTRSFVLLATSFEHVLLLFAGMTSLVHMLPFSIRFSTLLQLMLCFSLLENML